MFPGNYAAHVCFWPIALPLQLLLIVALLRGAYKRFSFLLLYTAANLILTLAEISPYTEAFRHHDLFLRGFAAKLYWVKLWTLQCLAFPVVLNLITQATGPVRRGRLVRGAVIAGAFLFAGAASLMRWSGPAMILTYWMRPWAHDLASAAGILDLALWTVLLAMRQVDRSLLLITSALGIQFVGDAIGEAVRVTVGVQIKPTTVLIGTVLGMLTEVTALYICWRALPRGASSDIQPNEAWISAPYTR